jgi:glutathione peroxidase
MIYDYKVKRRDGSEYDLSELKGKVVLIVNTATGCGFTPQYEGLENLYKKYHDKGLEILDFPCNQFGHQAPGDDNQIHEFCTAKYKTTFDQLKKIDVNGKNADPLYKYLKKQKHGLLSNIKWNFEKFLVDREGNVVERYLPTTTPEQIDEKIGELINE